MKMAVVFGTRPEAIKLAPVVLALRATLGVECRVCVTGQHRQMLDQVLEVFAIKPDVDLALMEPNQTLTRLTSRALEAVDHYLRDDKPDLVIVQGDTTTVFCAALASFYQRVPVAHVEAGLRTWDLQAPWPEEANRVLATRLGAIHFAPTETSRRNLLREGVAPESVHVTGNTVVDALLLAIEKVRATPPVIPKLPPSLQPATTGGGGPRMVLITGHRRENFGMGLEAICSAIAELAQRFPAVHFVYALHLNPNVREPVRRLLGAPQARTSNIHLIEPQPYLPFVGLMSRAHVILTDSGGVQEEAPSLGKPVLVMRETTERPEAVDAGTVRLVGTSQAKIVGEVSRLLADSEAYRTMARAHNPYGDGKATGRIVGACIDLLRARAAPRG
ncbi:MAG: non-hydrolyzing UDP-N-acetylglucosamine 2-epimerase [Gemmataceae bacterium]